MGTAIAIKTPEKVVDSNNPWGDDELGRKEYVHPLLNLINSSNEPLTIAFDGDWGAGKTFFLQRFRHDLEKAGAQALYFSAWECDFVADPLVAIIGQLQKYLHTKSAFKSEVKKLKKSALRYLDVLAGQSSSVIAHFTGLDIWGATKLLRSAIRSSMESYADFQRIRAELIGRLHNLAQRSVSGPIVCIIDELDRCRPTFAIEAIERIKHLFGVQNMVFVIGVNKAQLSESVKAVYGDIDTENYLRRFFDCTFCLPAPNVDVFVMNRIQGSGVLRIPHIQPYVQQFVHVFSELALVHDFALREIEDAIRMFSIYAKVNEGKLTGAVELLAIMIAMRTRNMKLYASFVDFKLTSKEIIEFLWTEHPEEWHDKNIMHLVAYIVYAALGNGRPPFPDMPDFLGWLNLSKVMSESDAKNRFPWPGVLYKGTFKGELYAALIQMQNAGGVVASRGDVANIAKTLDCFS